MTSEVLNDENEEVGTPPNSSGRFPSTVPALEREVARLQQELLQRNHQYMSLQAEYRSSIELVVRLQVQLKSVIEEERTRSRDHAMLIEQYELELNRLRRDYPLRQLLMVKETEISRLESHLIENQLPPPLQRNLEEQLKLAHRQRDRLIEAIAQTDQALRARAPGPNETEPHV